MLISKEVTQEDYDSVVNVNLKGVFFATGAIAFALETNQPPREDYQY